jgi:DNA primase
MGRLHSMAGMITEASIRRVKEAIDLADLFADYTQVVRAGGMHKANCPIHKERTPSCVLYEDGHYHCFGCGAHGDVFSIVREMENCSFVEAVERLAQRAGIELEYEAGKGPRRDGRRNDFERVMAWATRWYRHVLVKWDEAAAARKYCRERGLSEETCEEFQIGWAPSGGKLVAAARRNGVPLGNLPQLDLARERDQGGLRDRFFNRLLFPIHDRFGKPVAYSGRLLPADERAAKEAGRGVGKYVNSTETPLFSKGDILFNLHRARRAARQAKRLVVMEGQVDVIAAYQAGLQYCVASLGTAFTTAHVQQLTPLVGDGDLVLCFDADAAGRASSAKAARLCYQHGVPCLVASLPEGGKDAADLLLDEPENGAVALQEAFERGKSGLQFVLRHDCASPQEAQPHQRWQMIDGLLPMLEGSAEDRELTQSYAEVIALWFDVPTPQLMQRWQRQRSSGESSAEVAATRDEEPVQVAPPVQDLPADLDALLQVLVRRPELRGPALEAWGIEPCWFPAPWHELVLALLGRADADFEALRLSPVVVENEAVQQAIFRWQRDQLTRSGEPLSAPAGQWQNLAARHLAVRLDDELAALQRQMRISPPAAQQELFQKSKALRERRKALLNGA